MAHQTGSHTVNQDSEDRASIRRLVNDSSLHTSERFLPQPTMNMANPSAAVSFPPLNPHYARANNSSGNRQGSAMSDSRGAITPTSDDMMIHDDFTFFSPRRSSISVASPYQDSTASLDDRDPSGQMVRRHSNAQEDTSGQAHRQPQYVSDGTSRSQASRRELHAVRQGLRRSENRAVLKISLAQGRIDSPYEPASLLSSYNRQQSGRDVKETYVISMSTMTSAAKTRVFNERTDYILERCLEAQQSIEQLSQKVDPSIQATLADVHTKIQQAVVCARDRESIRERVGEVVESMHPVYNALVKEVQERNDNAGDVPFDAQTYFEQDSSLFQQMRTGRLD